MTAMVSAAKVELSKRAGWLNPLYKRANPTHLQFSLEKIGLAH